jgi:type I restriction enzyme, S subunit
MTCDGWRAVELAAVVVEDGLQTGPFGSQLKASEYTEDGIPVIMPKDMVGGRVRVDTVARVPDRVADRLAQHRVKAGDILFARRGDIGRCALINEEEAGWLCGTGCLRARPCGEIWSAFLRHALSSGAVVGWLIEHAVGQTMLNLNTKIIGGLPFRLPPLAEQRKIAAILSSVDDATEASQAVIDQLQVVKKAMMAELLTKGLPGRHKKFKQTEIGEVPEDWDVVPGEGLFALSGGYGPSDLVLSSGGAALFLKVDDFNLAANERGLETAALRYDPSANPRIKTYPPGVLVFPKRGAAIFKNRVKVLRTPATVDPNLMVLSPGPRLDAGFFAYEMLFVGLHNLSDNSGIPQINNKHLYPHEFLAPPLAEQQAICDVIDSVEEQLVAASGHQVAVRHLKSALMSVLLTGEVRVRPDEEAA